jgi:hypothetical protein
LEEQLSVTQLHWVNVRVRSAQGAGGFFDRITFQSVGTAMSKHSWRLVWQDVGGIHNLIFDLDFVIHMITMCHFFDFPNFFCHIELLTLKGAPSVREKGIQD